MSGEYPVGKIFYRLPNIAGLPPSPWLLVKLWLPSHAALTFGMSQQDGARACEGRVGRNSSGEGHRNAWPRLCSCHCPAGSKHPGQKVLQALGTQQQQIRVQSRWDEPPFPAVHSLQPWHAPLGTGTHWRAPMA